MSPNPEMEASVNVNSEVHAINCVPIFIFFELLVYWIQYFWEVEIVVGWMKKSWDHFKMLEDGESTFNLFLKM
jgi:hypothetical protein